MNYSRFTLALFILGLSSTLAAGCGLELDYGPPRDAMSDAFGDASLHGNDVGVVVDASASDAGLDAFVSLIDANTVDASTVDAPDIGPVECVVDSDCDVLHGAPPCGAWQCSAFTCGVVCASCTDADLDGYGVGIGCAGADCDDSNDMILDASTRSCGAGSSVGACHDGTETCTAGTWGACLGAQGPTPESCNDADDDCDGVVDDGFGMVSCGIGACTSTVSVCSSGAITACTPTAPIAVTDNCGSGDEDCDGRIDEDCGNCVWVATFGNDLSANPRLATSPMATVQAAINVAAMDPTFSLRVCLLSNGCGASTANAIFNGPVHMANGVHVQGNYAPGGAMLCGSGLHTELRPPAATGVLFDGSIMRHTEIADVMITPAPTSTSAGITVNGAHSAVISGVFVLPTGGVINGYGIDVHGGGDAIVQRSIVFAGRGSSEAIGIRVVDARATIVANCTAPLDAAGRCTGGCSGSGGAGIRGRVDVMPSRATTSYAILLRNAPGSIVESSTTCGAVAADGAGVRIDGPATGVIVRGNFIAGFGPQNASYGIDLAGCAGASPLITDNAEINAEAPLAAPAVAIHSAGDCHPIIQNNLRIVSGLEGSMTAIGIQCGADRSGFSSRCVIEGNPVVHAAVSGFPVTATGVSCEADACARIERNDISGTQGATLVGLRLATGTALVARNRISGGCGSVSAIGIVAVNSRARLENNVVLGAGPCLAGSNPSALRFIGLSASATDATYALDAHGNDFDPGSLLLASATCVSRGVELTGHPGVDVGALRGNIMLAGACSLAYPIYEVDADSDPIALEYNDLVAASGGAAYRDEGMNDIATAAGVDALGDTVLVGDVSVPPGFMAYPGNLHLMPGSMCIDLDMSSGAPTDDFDGRARSGLPDLGAFEH